MSDDNKSTVQAHEGNDPKSADASQDDRATPANNQIMKEHDPVRRGTTVLLVIVALLFVWYIAADRLAPWTDQARIDGFVVPITPKVSGKVKNVYVVQDQEVEAGDKLAKIDPRPYELALQRAEARLEIAGSETGEDTADVARAEAGLAKARAQLLKAEQDLERTNRILEQEPGAVSQVMVDDVRAARESALANEANAIAELEKAKERLGSGGEDNPRVRDAVAALEQARIDLTETILYAPTNGAIVNQELEAGRYAKKGSPIMTLVSYSGLWIEAYLRENSWANIKAGDPVDIALDTLPGRIYKGTVVSKGGAVQNPAKGFIGGLATVKGSSGWLRDSQRFPVVIKFDDESASGYRNFGGQVDVQIYTQSSNFVLNALQWFWIRLMSWLSYVY